MCGLFAWSGDNKNKFNWYKFAILGILNEDRGGDSCGRSHGNLSTKGIGLSSSYEGLMVYNHQEELDASFILGHTRRASVGGVSLDKAQPIVIKENDSISFHLIHNGTIHNYVQLANKYHVDHIGRSDSQVLAEIIKDHGFGVLSEYQGAASLVFCYMEDPDTIYAFRGESSFTSESVVMKEERPLYYCIEEDGSMYINSTESPLIATYHDPDKVIEFDANTVYEINGGKIINTHKIDRTNSFQKKRSYYNRANVTNYSNKNTNLTALPPKTSSKNIEFEPLSKPNEDSTDLVYYNKGRFWVNGLFAHGFLYVNQSGLVKKSKDGDMSGFGRYYFIRGIMINDHSEYDKIYKYFAKANYKISSSHNVTESPTVFNKYLEHSFYPAQQWEPFNNNSHGFMRVNGDDNSSHLNSFLDGEISTIFSNRSYCYNNGDLVSWSTGVYKSPDIPVVDNPKATETIIPDEEDECPRSEYEYPGYEFESGSSENPDEPEFYEHLYQDQIIKDEIKRILNETDRNITLAKQAIEELGSGLTVNMSIDALETTQELLDTTVENL